LKNVGQQRIRQLGAPGFRRNRGFSLFELVVFIISVAIIYAYAVNRFAEFPAQAERASFTGVLLQLQTGINLELISAVARGNSASASLLEDINPMDLMLLPPSNYLGAYDAVSVVGFSRRSWYFNTTSNELVYLVGVAGGVSLSLNSQRVPVDEIRFRVTTDYGELDLESGLDVRIASRIKEIPRQNRRSRLNGVILMPVFPYSWDGLDEELLISEAITDGGG
jgi:type II secretory pathway pseudopilin PulG